MNKIRVLGITLQRNVAWDRGFCIMAFGDIAIAGPEVTMRGCALARSSGRIIALPPKVPGAKMGDPNAIQWNANGEFALRVRDLLLEAYRKMGGEMPPSTPAKAANDSNANRRIRERQDKSKPRFVPYGDLDIDPDSDVTIKDQAQAALDRIHNETGEDVFTSVLEFPEPEASDDEAVDGLHRVLGVDAVAETMERAGL